MTSTEEYHWWKGVEDSWKAGRRDWLTPLDNFNSAQKDSGTWKNKLAPEKGNYWISKISSFLEGETAPEYQHSFLKCFANPVKSLKIINSSNKADNNNFD